MFGFGLDSAGAPGRPLLGALFSLFVHLFFVSNETFHHLVVVPPAEFGTEEQVARLDRQQRHSRNQDNDTGRQAGDSARLRIQFQQLE